MTQVKYNDQKWWVLHQESWVEIEERYWDRIKQLVCYNLFNGNMPITDQIYSLPNEVEFEIREMCCANKQIRVDTQCANCSHWIKVAYLADPKIPNGLGERKEFGSVKVAHLKDSEPKKE